MRSARLTLTIGVLVGALAAPAIYAADPVAHWGFGTEERSQLLPVGGVQRDLPGPRPPEFPDFDADNTAVKLDGTGSHFVAPDPGDNSPFDFTNGDAITLEAWVNPTDARDGENLYVVGKGRTGDPAFAKDNQNWAMRLRVTGELAHASFLFATPHEPGEPEGAFWHRWTSTAGFAPNSGWHRIAISYRFGESETIVGWVDGKRTKGTWDMGGATSKPPVVDNDAIWIGSSLGGRPTNSFRGMLDEISIYREVLSDDVMRSRFRIQKLAGPAPIEVAPSMGEIPPGRVLVTFTEGLAAHERWPVPGDPPAKEISRWITEDLAIPRLPLRYDSWGIRQAWAAPVLVRAAADMKLSPGSHRMLVRARGLSRLWVNEKLVARTGLRRGLADGHEPVHPIPDPPSPGVRPVSYGDQEAIGQAEIGRDGNCHIIFEAIVGGKRLRPEPGDMCVAIQDQDSGPYVLLSPNGVTQVLDDATWNRVAERANAQLSAMDDATRRAAAKSQDAFWERRHQLATQWVKEHPAPAVPTTPQSAELHPIDAFLVARIERAAAGSHGAAGEKARQFHETVLKTLSDNCFRCHAEKQKGGLRLTSLESALKGGSSGHPAVIPGKPDASEILARLRNADPEERMPPKSDPLKSEQITEIEAWIAGGAQWPDAPMAPEELAIPGIVDDSSFLRRAYLDTVGVLPTESEAREFLTDTSGDKRVKLVDRLLADDRFPDHWMPLWQDLLAENPNFLKPSLNNTGPFRWFLYEALRDNKPIDRLVTELIIMRGGKYDGGSAGFGMAADNDAPLAAKAQVLGSAFLGLELQCARCHDAPFHNSKQRDLYAVAAMLDRRSATVPKSSTVPATFFERKARQSLIKVTLRPGESIAPAWPFEKDCQIADDHNLDSLVQDPADTRQRLAALITAPQNHRFARVMVNRVWKRLMGAGFVEPAADWEAHAPSHPELLDWLAIEFVGHDYDLKHVVRLVLTSSAYQRRATGHNLSAPSEKRLFAAPDRRRLEAEQVVDSLFAAAGKSIDVEELTFDPDARQTPEAAITLGKPRRAWMFGSLSNERDRPSLALPRAQAVTDVLEAFGWTGARQNPRSDRETDPNVLQPGVLANSLMSTWITRVSANGALAALARRAHSPEEVVDGVFLQFLTRLPSSAERESFTATLAPGFAQRIMPAPSSSTSQLPRLPRVSWSNHLMPEATTIKNEMERRARLGDPPDPGLSPQWREAYEDMVWSVINSPEFVWIP
jgi:hypothetical protein